MAKTNLENLLEAYGEIVDLGRAAAVLSWDQQTYMPVRGAEARGQQLATLASVMHERMVDPKVGDLIAAALAEEITSEQRRAVEEIQFQRDRSTKLPKSLVEQLAKAEAKSFELWHQAKRSKSFAIFAEQLESHVELIRQKAECYGYEGSPWNALVVDYERGSNVESVRQLFGPLKERTIALLDRIRGSQRPNTGFIDQIWPVDRQVAMNTRILQELGFDFNGGRMDVAPHPFCTGFGKGDVRITTRYRESTFIDSLSSTMHEMGHAIYDQNMFALGDRSPLADAPSYGVHESQSRFWEVRVGCSRAFWERYLPVVNQYFPGQLDGVSADDLYRAVNKVESGFIRVDADEVCYNLHILIRFELEAAIFDKTLSIRDLPEAWNKKYKEYLGLDVPNDALGCLQDVHWAYGSFGYFPSYTLGNLFAAQLVEAMEKEIGDPWEFVRKGEFAPLHDWMNRKIHCQGKLLAAPDLIEKATGEKPSSEPLMRYFEKKYGELYK